jgi:general L-amino acid transport system permease protein
VLSKNKTTYLTMSGRDKIPFWRDDRVVQILGQSIVVVIVAIIFVFLGSNLRRNFQQLGLGFGFNFLNRPASFGLGDTPIPYSPTDPYTKAIFIGLINSLRVMFFGIILASVVGITVGISRLSSNWLVRKLATIYVEVIRNTPLLLQLFFWYFAVFLKFPKLDNPIALFDRFFFTNQGVYLPVPAGSIFTWLSVFFLLLIILVAILFSRRQTEIVAQQERFRKFDRLIFLGLAIASSIVFIFGLDWRIPRLNLQENIILGGMQLSTEFATILIGLSIYTAAYIAEVVRAGIQSVDRGQREAAIALGLKSNLTMRLIIFPQALRLMIPPLTNEYLNLIKNSSLAVAIGYNDVYAVSSTVSNQTGRSIEILLVIVCTYLSINLIVSLVMNWFNRKVQLKTSNK